MTEICSLMLLQPSDDVPTVICEDASLWVYFVALHHAGTFAFRNTMEKKRRMLKTACLRYIHLHLLLFSTVAF